MSKTAIIIKREFLEFVQTRTFLIMTLLGPLLLAGFIALEVLILTRVGGGETKVVIIDQSPNLVGAQVSTMLAGGTQRSVGKRTKFATTVITQPANLKQITDSLTALVTTDSLNGYLVIPSGILTGEAASYFGKDATNMGVTTGMQGALQQTVQSTRLSAQGIDPAKVTTALKPVELHSEKIGKGGVKGSAEAGQVLGYLMGFAIYLVTVLYGQAIMNSVLEEKRDKIVEVIVSSVRARELLIGKILGIGAAGFLQMLIWVASVGLVLAYAGSIATILHLGPEKSAVLVGLASKMPHVPPTVGVVFLLFFLGGFFIYSTMFATIGAIVTTNQEAQQLVFPTALPLMIGFLMSMTTLTNPDAPMAVIGSMVPFTAPMVMPIRTAVGSAPITQIALSLLFTFGLGLLVVWFAAKIYRIGIFATGKKPTMKEVVRWVRAS